MTTDEAIAEVRRLPLEPGDVLFVRLSTSRSEAVNQVLETLRRILPKGVGAIVADAGTEAEIMRAVR